MTRPLAVLFALAFALPAAAQHHSGHSGADGVTEAFTVAGLRVDEAAPPAGSGVGRAGLRFDDGGYVSIVHGKPYRRGRSIFGGVVEVGAVWAGGAHRATELFTTVPLMLGGTHIPAGAYSLFVTPGERFWKLHLNTRLGMHLADEYDPAEDLATYEVPATVLTEPVDGLTWSFETDSGLALRLAWDRLAAEWPFHAVQPE